MSAIHMYGAGSAMLVPICIEIIHMRTCALINQHQQTEKSIQQCSDGNGRKLIVYRVWRDCQKCDSHELDYYL